MCLIATFVGKGLIPGLRELKYGLLIVSAIGEPKDFCIAITTSRLATLKTVGNFQPQVKLTYVVFYGTFGTAT